MVKPTRKKICRNCKHCFLEWNCKFACGKTDDIIFRKYNDTCPDYIPEKVEYIYSKFN